MEEVSEELDVDGLSDDPLLICNMCASQKTVLLFVQEGSSQQATSCSSSLLVVITSNEEQVIKYISGYVPFKLLQKFGKQKTPKAASFVVCLGTFAVKGCSESFHNYVSEWTQAVSRGGVYTTTDEAFILFRQLEVCVRKYLTFGVQQVTSESQDTKGILQEISKDNEIQFHWSMLSSCIDNYTPLVVYSRSFCSWAVDGRVQATCTRKY